MIRAAIVEDDGKSAEILRRHISRYGAESGTETAADIFTNAEQFLSAYKPVYDVVFMDIELGTILNGMDAAKRLRKYDETVNLIFVTNMAQYALQGYKVNALDYFVKPVSYYDLKMRMERIRRQKGARAPTVAVPVRGGVKNIAVSDLLYVEVMNHAATYHTAGGGNFTARIDSLKKAGDGNLTARIDSLKKLEKALATAGFCRCGSSFLVNLKKVKEIAGDTVKVGNDTLHISRGMKKNFIAALFDAASGAGRKTE
ncbi:MAG: LytTR family DNA-binding domain-containing protein [Clostridiales bacterium]|jgi:DNA-binding LytR/AlgR family response regulator|nr:LytTR family DNA-binding domain-containing protein [Clostridiales bacterium]